MKLISTFAFSLAVLSASFPLASELHPKGESRTLTLAGDVKDAYSIVYAGDNANAKEAAGQLREWLGWLSGGQRLPLVPDGDFENVNGAFISIGHFYVNRIRVVPVQEKGE